MPKSSNSAFDKEFINVSITIKEEKKIFVM